ncbi:MAG: glycoside hydrolase 43 family protein [Roseburia sp.]|nr:glycoside hydrolase 43 family protein [Roseburia sp.]
MKRLWKADLGNGTYKNPILFADYSDPDVIRVGDTYYMTASSFNYVPGLPILTSKDLVNWTLVNYAIDKINYEKYDAPQHAKGVWAPAIRYHEGEFYIYYGMPDEGIFMVKTKDALGKWEEPVLVLEGKGLIDPCPFWDEDGKAYVVHGYAKSRIGFKSFLGIFEMSWDGKKAVSEDHILYNGLETQPTIEGPKVYKRDGYYYIFAPAGSVKTGWQTILRAKNIHGPFEEKIVLRQGTTKINGPHQGALVDTVNGDEWFLHFQDRGMYGRIVHMQPVTWVDGWPVMGENAVDYCGEPVSACRKPNVTSASVCYLEASDDFSSEKLNLMWQWLGNPKEDFYSLSANPNHLRLYCKNPSKAAEPILWDNANVLTQKLVCPFFTAESCLHITGLGEKEQAGMVMMGGDYAYLGVRTVNGKKTLVLSQSSDKKDGEIRANGQSTEKEETVTVLATLEEQQEQVWLVFEIKEKNGVPFFAMKYSLDGENYTDVAVDFMPSDHTWVGAKIGLFANVLGQEEKGGYGDFAYIRVEAVEI